jgi:DNA repair exonuclease SbcCD ATPase subunit
MSRRPVPEWVRAGNDDGGRVEQVDLSSINQSLLDEQVKAERLAIASEQAARLRDLQKKLDEDVRRERLHTPEALRGLPADHDAAVAYVSEEQRAVRSLRGRRRWRRLEGFDDRIDELQRRREATISELQQLNERRRKAEDADRDALATWQANGAEVAATPSEV